MSCTFSFKKSVKKRTTNETDSYLDLGIWTINRYSYACFSCRPIPRHWQRGLDETKLCDRKNYFNFHFVSFPFMCSNVTSSTYIWSINLLVDMVLQSLYFLLGFSYFLYAMQLYINHNWQNYYASIIIWPLTRLLKHWIQRKVFVQSTTY